MRSPVVHFFRGEYASPRYACGVWHAKVSTRKRPAVTCKRCLRRLDLWSTAPNVALDERRNTEEGD